MTGPSGGAVVVVGLGDSVPAASACACPSFVTLVARGLAHHRTPLSHNLAVPGQTSAGLLGQLASPTDAAFLGTAGVVLVTIGANDFNPGIVTEAECAVPDQPACYGTDLSQLSGNIAAILDMISELDSADGTRVVVIGYWNVFLDGEVGRARGDAYVDNSAALTGAVNRILSSAAAQHGDDFVDLRRAFSAAGADDTRLLAPDGDHPSAAGHDLIAKNVLTTLRRKSHLRRAPSTPAPLSPVNEPTCDPACPTQ